MPARRLAAASAVVVATTLLGGSVILAQDPVEVEPGMSPGPIGSPVPGSPMPIDSMPPGSLPPGSPGASPVAELSGATIVPVTIQEVAVVPAMTTIPAGSVTFDVTNAGPELVHEFLVVRTDLPADALPTLEDGSFDEAGEGVEVVGELEAFEPGMTQSLTVDLAAGHHVLLCNVVADMDGAPFSHYQAGMRVDVEVVDAAASEMPMASAAASAGASMAPASTAPMPSEAPASPAA